jgi:hypothetical protein
MKIEYNIISSTHSNILIDKVTCAMLSGWLPQGGAFLDPAENWDKWKQTMIRETDEET